MDSLQQQYDDLLFGVRRSIRYHRRRQRFFEACHAAAMAVMVLSGSATVATFALSVGDAWPLWARLTPAILVTVLSTLDLAIGFSRRAWCHADLAHRFGGLEQDMTTVYGTDALTAAALAELISRRLDIEMKEPPALRVLDTLCHNDLLRAIGYSPDKQIKVNIWQRLFSQFFDLGAHRLG